MTIQLRLGGYQGPRSIHTRASVVLAEALDRLSEGAIKASVVENVSDHGDKAIDLLGGLANLQIITAFDVWPGKLAVGQIKSQVFKQRLLHAPPPAPVRRLQSAVPFPTTAPRGP